MQVFVWSVRSERRAERRSERCVECRRVLERPALCRGSVVRLVERRVERRAERCVDRRAERLAELRASCFVRMLCVLCT